MQEVFKHKLPVRLWRIGITKVTKGKAKFD
ncbi:hypothetical protein NIES298_26600 [Microcystis aeruginosa NIES-298]|nr:hypothetical protein NIES298_26600 [Microcystis aeruginosa NIES-298]